jgi:hypothetical protein
VIPSVASGTSYDIGAAVVGYHRGVLTRLGTRLGVGGRGSVNFVPAALKSTYGSRTPIGFLLYVSVGPA